MYKKTIKIFLASSIVEFATERMAIENFIRNVSDKFEERYDIKIKPLLCENFDDAYTVCRKQEEYNDKIRNSEFCFFIFFTKAGEFTREEFEVARKMFEETGKPRIYTYFKVLDEGETAEQSLYDFMDELDRTFGHYYGTFQHIDTVKLRILLSLKLEEMDYLEIKAEGGKCVVDGVSVMSLENVAEFVNNKYLTKLHEELKSVDEEYLQMKPIYAKGGCSDEFYRKYSAVASRRQSFVDEIDELESMIFNISLNLIKDSGRGDITLRQKEAYRLFELGDYEGCMAVLDSDEIDDEFLREEKRDAERRKARRKKYIREYKTKIEILSVMKDYDKRFEEIDECYKKIVPYALEEKIELEVVLDYIDFMNNQNENPIPLAEKFLVVCENFDGNITPEGKASIFELMGRVYKNQGDRSIAEDFTLRSIEILENLVRKNPDRFESNLANSYNSAGNFYEDCGNPTKAEFYYLKSIDISERLAKINPKAYELDLAIIYNNAGIFYENQGDLQNAEACYLKSIEIYEKYVEDDSDEYEPDLARSYNNICAFYGKYGNISKAEVYLLKTIEIRERFAASNPDRYEPDLASTYNNAGALYGVKEDPVKAEMYYSKSIEIRERLAKRNSDRFGPELAGSYTNAGFYYLKQGNLMKSEEHFLKSIKIRESFVGSAPDRFEPELAVSYYYYGIVKRDLLWFEKALEIAFRYTEHPDCRRIIEILTNP